MEARLKADVIEESDVYNCKVLVHDDTAQHRIVAYWEALPWSGNSRSPPPPLPFPPKTVADTYPLESTNTSEHIQTAQDLFASISSRLTAV